MNYKRLAIAVAAILLSWEVMDYVIHSLILMPIYAETASLWRPVEEMKMGVMFIVVLVSAITYVLLYAMLVKEKSLKQGLLFGLLFGIGTGISMGYGTYATQPIPYALAMGWSLGALAECLVAGALVGWLVRD